MPFPTPLAQALTSLNLPPYPSVTGLPQPITLRSLAAFFGSLVWAWLLLVSFTGWGRWTGKLFRVQRLPASVACSLGIAIIVFVGGWLNLLHAIYPSVLIALTAIGLAFYIALRGQRPANYKWCCVWKNSSLLSKILLLLTLLILVMRVAATIRLGAINTLDDIAAYMVFPHKMLAVHSFAADPFSDRRVISSLGGAYFIQGFVIAATSLAHIAMADRTLGLILLGCVLLDAGIAFNLSTFQIALLGFLAYLVPIETINLTFIILPVSLLLSMAWLLWRTAQEATKDRWKNAFLAGAIGGTAIAMKSTYLPIIGTFALIPCWVVLGRRQAKTAFRLFVITGLGSAGLLLAWMIAMKQVSGTYLFPVLGHGVDYSSYGVIHARQTFHSYRAFLKIFLQGAVLLAMAALQLFLENKSKQSRFSIGILVAAACAITAFNYKSGGDFIWRYNFPQFFCAIIIFYLATASARNNVPRLSRHSHLLFSAGILAVFTMIFYYDAAGQDPRPFRQMAMEWEGYRPSLRASLTGLQLASPRIKAEYDAAENSLPPDATALENTAYPFLFNYAKRNILIADWPGAASPSRAWPFRGNDSEVTQYLRDHSVHYLIYDYGYARWEDVEACTALETPLRNSEELSLLWWMSLLAHHQFERLRTSFKSNYDDGQIAVIDLDSPQQDTRTPVPLWTLDTSNEQICSAVLANYLANPLPSTSR